MEIRNLNISDQMETSFVENLYIESFPPNERRDVDKMMKLYQSETPFFISITIEEGRRVGFITYWKLGDFIFVEHFSIVPEFRNGGYGRKVIELFIREMTKPILLEVELPVTDLAKRRIDFYQRLGFKRWENIEYEQPPYTKNEHAIPMNLMSWGNVDVEENFTEIRKKIYKKVYNCEKI